MKINVNKNGLLDNNIEDTLQDNEEILEENFNEQENYYTCKLSKILDIDMEDVDILCRNYSYLSKEEIIKALEKQQDYDVRFCHIHEWIDEDLIKKSLILDEFGSNVDKVVLEVPEFHDCNLIKLTPELQKKAYRWHRGNRNTTSHLIDRDDCSKINKTNKLTIVWKREYEFYYDEDWDKIEEPYFLVITAFRWDWKGRKEIRDDDEYICYSLDTMGYWINHALIPEIWEVVTKTDEPSWVEYYKEKTN